MSDKAESNLNEAVVFIEKLLAKKTLIDGKL